MTMRIHLFRDEDGSFRLSHWHLMIVRVSEPDDGVHFCPPDARAQMMLHISSPSRAAVVSHGLAETLHEILRRREGASHSCPMCAAHPEERSDANAFQPPQAGEASGRSSGCEPTKGGA